MKSIVLTVSIICALTATAWAAVTFGITSLDKEYTLHTNCGGSAKMNKLGAHATTSITIQGSAPCVIQYGKGGIASGDLKELKGGETITVKDGKLSKK